MNWNEFLAKIKEAKKTGKSKGLNVGCIARLIYSGVFDSMIGGQPKFGTMITTYRHMFEDVKSSLKSTTSLPKPPKNERLGLNNLKNDVELSVWRSSTNPLSRFNFLESPNTRKGIEMRGFVKNNHLNKDFERDFPYIHNGNENNVPVKIGLTTQWRLLFTKKYESLFKACQGKEYQIAIFGVIVGIKYRKYSNNTKTMGIVEFFDGNSVLNNLILWPSRDSGQIDQKMLISLTPGNSGIMTVSPYKNGGYESGAIKRFDRVLID